jgi:hypothetical protein
MIYVIASASVGEAGSIQRIDVLDRFVVSLLAMTLSS